MWTTSSEGFSDRTWTLIHIAAASVLHRTIRDSNIYIRAHNILCITATPRLHLNPRASNQFTVLQNLLVGKLKNYRILIWHDVINNSMTPHSSNNNNPCTVKILVVILKGIKKRVIAIVYCRRKFKGKLRPDISELLAETGLRKIEVKRHLMSRRKNSDPVYLDELAELHPTPASQSIFLQTILWHLKKTADREELQPVQGRRRSKVKRQSQKKRKQAQEKREKKQQA